MKKESTQQQYELTFILGEKAGQEEGSKKTAFVTKIIEKLGGKVTKEEPWGRRELAYEIGKNRSGYYVTLWFDAPVSAVDPLERELRFDEEIIRFLTIKAYATAQPGTLYPVVEEKPEKTGPKDKEETSTGEEMLRRSPAIASKDEELPEDIEEISEEERLEKLDAALDSLLKEEKEDQE